MERKYLSIQDVSRKVGMTKSEVAEMLECYGLPGWDGFKTARGEWKIYEVEPNKVEITPSAMEALRKYRATIKCPIYPDTISQLIENLCEDMELVRKEREDNRNG